MGYGRRRLSGEIGDCHTTASATPDGVAERRRVARLARVFVVLDRGLHDLAIGLHPLRLLDELAALDLEDLHPAAAFMLGGRDRQRRHQSAEIELLDALEALLDVLAFGRLAAGLLQRVLQRLD